MEKNKQRQICKHCIYFRQHYMLVAENYYFAGGCGHCVYPQLKHRPPDHTACQRFVPIEALVGKP